MSDRLKAYARAGVDVDLGNKVKAGLPALVQSANRPEVLGKVGGFGGLFSARFPKMRDPVLVASIDGVGTKLKIAVLMNRHDTIGEDLVNHCVNDIAVLGAEPLFFLDYMASERLDPERFRQLISGMIRGCRRAGCALIGGETAQMPGIYHGSDYDLVGTIVGIVDRAHIIDGKSIRPGDAVIGLPSSGLHTNGYSLAREILFNQLGCRIESRTEGLRGTVGDELLRTHILYLPQIRKVRAEIEIKGIAHITGGGLMDNIPRILPEGLDAEIELGTWTAPPLFKLLASAARIKNEELHQVFNMGIGMVFVVAAKDAEKTLRLTRGKLIGRIVKGNRSVLLKEPAKKSRKK
ncbi:MAG TPA: phosphoribosylformylglycinamidine cyclo-ligase [Candidatus Methylacidiphilales bacterium]|jgi:phosphoribosylformylglycinamidine cyclo-ligase|nr:phosphoribosylformylglycinamidine cyclo-ligase [Candidatus Methylacidiphilales bacterium]